MSKLNLTANKAIYFMACIPKSSTKSPLFPTGTPQATAVMFAFKLSNLFAGYAYQPLSSALPLDTERPTCRREYGIEEDDSAALCQTLQTPCGYIIGSACVERMIQKGFKM
ncbi:hypothetical protein DPSP01_005267 [Paraphaeosphaeria sporulosa]